MVNEEDIYKGLVDLFIALEGNTYPESKIANEYTLKLSSRFHISEWYLELKKEIGNITYRIHDFYLREYYDNPLNLFDGSYSLIDDLVPEISQKIQEYEQEK